MKLTLLLPGLLWLDGHDGADVCKGLELPALQRLLGQGERVAGPATLSELLTAPWRGSVGGLARLRARQAGLLAEQGDWLLADPVHVRVDRDRALLADVGVMSLSQAEAETLADAANRHFADDGWRIHPLEPGRWLLQLDAPAAASFSPLPDVVGEDINAHLPQGERGLDWSRLLNELQMLLYAHPLNDEREARGELGVNSLWLWGGGVEPGWRAPAEQVFADEDWLGWIAAEAGAPCLPAPYDFAGFVEQAGVRDCLVALDALQAAAQYRDAWGWREALQRLERDWFAPLLRALRQGRIDSLVLRAHGHGGLELKVRRNDLWKFWKRPLPLSALY